MEKLYYGPLWPMGHISVAYRGDGQVLTANLSGATETSEYEEAAAKGLIITPCRQNGSVFADNSGYIYLCMKSADGTYDSLNHPETVVLAIRPAAGPVNIPFAEYGGNKLLMTQLGIDADVNGDGAFVTGIMQ